MNSIEAPKSESTSQSQSSEIFGPLADITKPTLFRNNAFRMVGLLADASALDIKRRFEKVKMMQKLGGKTPFRSALPLSPPPDEDQLREAVHRLKDPQKALLEALFWLWPVHTEENPDDPALKALTQNDVLTALKSWSEQEDVAQNGNLPTHNLAVLHHSLALDAEAGPPEKRNQAKPDNDTHWSQAFQAWKRLIGRDAFWGKLLDRIQAFDDPRLTSATAHRLRKDLPVALLSINAQLAVQAAERGEILETQRHRQIMKTSGFDQGTIDAAFRREIAPTSKRIQILCRQASEEASSNVPQSDGVAEKLLKQARSALTLLDHVLGEGDVIRDNAYDEVARSALNIAIEFGNTTRNWSRALTLIQASEPLAMSVSTKNKITDNLNIVTQNVADTHCWFCENATGDEKHALKHPMYGEVQHLYNKITWKKRTVEVPRCIPCSDTHRMVERAKVKSGFRGLRWGFWGGFLVTFIWRLWHDLPLAGIKAEFMNSFSREVTSSFGVFLQENLSPVLQNIAEIHALGFFKAGGIALGMGVLLCIVGGFFAEMEKGPKTYRHIAFWNFSLIFLGSFFWEGSGVLPFDLFLNIFAIFDGMPISALPYLVFDIGNNIYSNYGLELRLVSLKSASIGLSFSLIFLFFAWLGRDIKPPEGIKKVSKDTDYPEIKKLKEKGWQFGSEPPAQN